MNVEMEEQVSCVILRVEGRLDSNAAQDFDFWTKKALALNTHRVIFDFAGVDYICSASIRPLLKAYKQTSHQERYMEIINTTNTVRKVLLVVGLGDLLPVCPGPMQVIDIFQNKTPCNEQTLRNARLFLTELLGTLGIKIRKTKELIAELFYICDNGLKIEEIEDRLKTLLVDLELERKIRESLKDRASIINSQLKPFIGPGSILDIGAGDGELAATFAENDRTIQLLDVVNTNRTNLPFDIFDGMHIPYESKSYDYTLLITVLHHCNDPFFILKEAMRVTRKRLIITESVFLNETNRRFNMFFDWFYNRILRDNINVPYNFNTPHGWEQIFTKMGLKLTESIEIGIDQITVPEYHWLFVLDID